IAPLFVRCEPGDLGHSVELRSPHFKRPTITLFDSHRDGVGLSEQTFPAIDSSPGAARAFLDRGRCAFGCPACIGPESEVGGRGKPTARALAAVLMGDREAASLALAAAVSHAR